MFSKLKSWVGQLMTGLGLAAVATVSQAQDSAADTIFAAVDLSGLLAKVTPILVIGVGIAIAFKAISFAKRAISKT